MKKNKNKNMSLLKESKALAISHEMKTQHANILKIPPTYTVKWFLSTLYSKKQQLCTFTMHGIFIYMQEYIAINCLEDH
jgi:hypothetical protein